MILELFETMLLPPKKGVESMLGLEGWVRGGKRTLKSESGGEVVYG